ncbi:hypothetical protein A2803_05180 [Candidatus Woesebacteria bacterium RIFCSPHIGHO2_01_FULL_44_21]|uniref:Nudix hydrolase domain-containing protein n=1 Tax=Candidatus Woesebacteria bacterium RIFCSPHIGHO2_01_FULL_44_21 TaxID=1802503 RepID=A0A1F7Z085_9BACT|nr:MAG: hypothetical protein A2803_05180 [Candidatus Woesebacteria bacterium RIFCSPHIGHO2_01_FULL_44_21]OGM68873.1 MAG: hypothetical protein A2897_01795 [Candidatus Woesebacteria bacterium RIFCSPLOWO2_01_FULL_44_24b]
MVEVPRGIDIKYTIGFCVVPAENKVLMLYRNNRPNKDKWNGLGGKINFDAKETPQECVIREISEETDKLIDLSLAPDLRYTGIVTWDVTTGEEKHNGGMHAYVANFNDRTVIFNKKETREGVLDWLDLTEVTSKDNSSVVENIPHFLPEMLKGHGKARYHCVYEDGNLVDFAVSPLK